MRINIYVLRRYLLMFMGGYNLKLMRIDGCCLYSSFQIFLKWYKNGRRGNGGLRFAWD